MNNCSKSTNKIQAADGGLAQINQTGVMNGDHKSKMGRHRRPVGRSRRFDHRWNSLYRVDLKSRNRDV
ncbi:hypothetical protein PK21_gp32 [Geobacillus phage vB_GthS_PK2.1]|nr:hypothetical protein PK21_gp32 [Geobacillus phage vB_GthS_PK2.1]